MFKIGFDIGGTNIACGLIDADFNIVNRASIPFVHAEPEDIALLLNELTQKLCTLHGIALSDIEMIGICIPGSIDKTYSIVIDAYNIGFHNVPFRELVENATGKPAMLLNDADAATIAEHRIGGLKGAANAILITIGTGIGGGIILNDRLFRGGMGNGVELGHIQMDGNGSLCTCGRIGCIETLCSASYLTKCTKKLYAAGNAMLNKYLASNDAMPDAKALIECAKAGDVECLHIWNKYIDRLSDALASLINILDPELIAIGGGLSNAGDFLIEPLNHLSNKKCFFDNSAKIIRATLGNDAGMIGAVMLK